MESPLINDAFLTKKSPRESGVDPAAEPSPRRSPRKYSAAEETAFFLAHDRIGHVKKAAAAVGMSYHKSYSLARKYGLLAPNNRGKPAPRRPFDPVERAEFFAVLARVGSVTVAAGEMGLPRKLCADWARAAGINSIHPGTARGTEYLRLRATGMGRTDAMAASGVSKSTVARLGKKQHTSDNRAATPTSQKVPYNRGVTSPKPAPATPPPGAVALADHDRVQAEALAGLEPPISTRYLSLDERLMIADLYGRRDSMQSIAKVLGRDPGTISREIKRNSHPVLGYLPHHAQKASETARARPKELKLTPDSPMWAYVLEKLAVRWSPEQMSSTAKKEFPHDGQMHVSHETIYKTLYIQAKGEMKKEIATALRTGRTRRMPHKDPLVRTSRFRDPMVNISERPPEVEDRAVPGHMEGDLITGTQNKTAIGTIVERTSRYVMLVHLPNDHTAESVRDGLIKTISTLPAHLRGSLTWDQGAEMAQHKAFTMATDMDVYFCDPASPWQRGSNENTNGLLRQYFPKSTDLSIYSAEDLEYVANELNDRPRKSLGWRTPAEVFRDLLIPS